MRVLVFGTFDILHPGHLYFLQQAKKHGQKLVVVLSRDQNVLALKGRLPRLQEQDRLKIIQGLKIVDQALLGDPRYRYERLVKKIKPDIIVLGYDQKETPVEIRQRLAPLGLSPKIVRLKACQPKKYKSSILKDN